MSKRKQKRQRQFKPVTVAALYDAMAKETALPVAGKLILEELQSGRGNYRRRGKLQQRRLRQQRLFWEEDDGAQTDRH